MVSKVSNLSNGSYLEDYSGDLADSRSVKAYLRELFLRAERKYKMRVWVDFVESDSSSGAGKIFMETVDKILTEKTVLLHGKF